MTTNTTTAVLTEKEAAKRLGVQRFVIRDAILYKASYDRLPAIDAGKGFLISAHDLDRWAESLTPRERLMVFPCTREGCAAAEDHWPHGEAGITPDGRPIHGRALEDSRPKDESGGLRICKTGEPDSWNVGVRAIGDEPWEVSVSASPCLISVVTWGNLTRCPQARQAPAKASPIRDFLYGIERTPSDTNAIAIPCDTVPRWSVGESRAAIP